MSAGYTRLAALGSALRRRWWVYPLVFVPSCVAATCWWLTEPLEDRGAAHVALRPATRPAPEPEAAAPTPVWPEGRLDGEEAKRRLLPMLESVARRLDGVDAYTATFYKQERIRGTLGPEQTLSMKVRHQPFAVYMKFLAPQAGKEVVYAEGHHDNKLIAHSGGFSRLLVPRLAVPPDHPLALADSRHAVTEAGLANLVDRLIGFRKLDLTDPHAETVLDRTTDAKGRPRYRSVHTHPTRKDDRPFARVEVLYDPDTMFPVEIRNFDWPGKSGRIELAESYRYENINLDAPLTALDFDPANPNYAFHRY